MRSVAPSVVGMASILPPRSVLGTRVPHPRPGEGPPRRAQRGTEGLRGHSGHRFGHERRFPRRRRGRRRGYPSPDPALRRRPSGPGHALPTPTSSGEEEGPRPKGAAEAPGPGGEMGTEPGEATSPRREQGSRRSGEILEIRVLEDLTLHGAGGKSRRMNRRLSSWPRREVHRQIEYKAALERVPVIKVNPQWTSKTCPVCGARRRDRVGQEFVCLMCDWEMDRQINAGMNILKTALASNEALARAVRFQPGALRDDVVSSLYDPPRGGAGARDEPSGVELGVSKIT